VLTGAFPADAKGFPVFDLDGMQLPEELPVSLPSSLVEQRPDIRASEELLHAASARIGVATANLYPQISLTGSYGSESTKLSDIFKSNASIWSIAGGLVQPVFHGGTLTAQRRAAIAAHDQAAAQYQETVLQAFQNVADVLIALDTDASALEAQVDAEAAAANALQLTQKQFQFGAASYLSLLNAERQYRQTRLGLVQARAARFADTAALFQAMGGGWWKKGDNP
jgi:NodT family efflux transporter outer membrane factor (OMF) lipoprotein